MNFFWRKKLISCTVIKSGVAQNVPLGYFRKYSGPYNLVSTPNDLVYFLKGDFDVGETVMINKNKLWSIF